MVKKLVALLVSVLLIATLFAGCGGGGNAVQDFLDEHGADLAADMESGMSDILGPGSSVSIEAGRSNELIYTLAYGPDMDMEGLGEMLPEVLAAMDVMFEPMAEAFRDEMGLNSFRITVRYTDSDGNVLAQESFDAQ